MKNFYLGLVFLSMIFAYQPKIIASTTDNTTPSEDDIDVYNSLDREMQDAFTAAKTAVSTIDIYPYMTFAGSGIYTLYMSKNSVEVFDQTDDASVLFDFAKSIGHIIVLLGVTTNQANWKEILTIEQQKIEKALENLPVIEKELVRYNDLSQSPQAKIPLAMNITPNRMMTISEAVLEASSSYIDERIRSGDHTLASYQAFAEKYASLFIEVSYAAFYMIEGRTHLQLNKWKEGMGEEQWNKLYVLMAPGAPDGAGIGAQIRGSGTFSTAYLHLETMFRPDLVKRNFISVSGFENATGILRDVKVNQYFADVTWPTEKMQLESKGLFDEIITPESTVGGGFIPTIISQIKELQIQQKVDRIVKPEASPVPAN
tara:strand:- start:385230 stop:386345 length:1116 start_codon:yes stop_codon:yes gene_type:complete